MSSIARRTTAALLLVATCGCSPLVQYTDELIDERTGRSFIVTVPATAGGFVGFIIGIPVDVLALPVTLPVYYVRKTQNELTADPVSTMLFPSFVLWRAGTLIGVPFDMVDYMFFRVWRPPLTPTSEEQLEIEYEWDVETLPKYPVEQLYPEHSAGAGTQRHTPSRAQSDLPIPQPADGLVGIGPKTRPRQPN